VLEGQTRLKKALRAGMPQGMGTLSSTVKSQGFETIGNSVINAGMTKVAKWRQKVKKNMPRFAGRPCMTEIAGDGIPNVSVQRIKLTEALFRSPDLNGCIIPINNVKANRSDLGTS